MTKKSNIPNIITLSRFPLTIWFLFLIIDERMIFAIFVFCIICATDILDGMVSRILDSESRLGAYLDVFTDLFFVISSLTILTIKGYTPVWFLLIVVSESILFCISSMISKRKYSMSGKPWIFDRLGKGFAVMAFVSPGVFCYVTIDPAIHNFLSYFLYSMFCLIAFLTALSRIGCCMGIKLYPSTNRKSSRTYQNVRNP